MTEVATTSRSISARGLTWTVLVAVPALAILSLGSGLLTGDVTGSAAPATASVQDTREFSRQGDDLAALTGCDQRGEAVLAQERMQLGDVVLGERGGVVHGGCPGCHPGERRFPPSSTRKNEQPARGLDCADRGRGRSGRTNGNSRGISPRCAARACTIRRDWRVPRRRRAACLHVPPTASSSNRARRGCVCMSSFPRSSRDVAASWDATSNARTTRDSAAPSVRVTRRCACLRCRAGHSSRPAVAIVAVLRCRRASRGRKPVSWTCYRLSG